MIKKTERLIPSYAGLPLALVLIINFSAFYGTRLINAGFHHCDLSLPIDRAIPLVPFFIVFYIAAFVQWVITYIFIARDTREVCFRYIGGDIIAKLICAVIFLILPTAMTRPEITGGDVFSKLTQLIYSLDTPDNLFPSVHCLESWICLRASLAMKKTGKGFAAVNIVTTLLVFASVVFVKQHLFVDIISGVAVAEAGLLINKLLCKTKLFGKRLYKL